MKAAGEGKLTSCLTQAKWPDFAGGREGHQKEENVAKVMITENRVTHASTPSTCVVCEAPPEFGSASL